MGAFYGSIHVRTENSDVVQKAIDHVAKEANCKFLLGPAINGWISVFPENGGQSDQISAETAKRLPNDIFHLIVHDDDIFSYYFYRNGKLVDQYNSCPDYFEKISDEEKQQCKGRPELFQDILRVPESLSDLNTLLAADGEKFTFEQERMAQFVELLGLSNALSSYEYLQQGERDEIKGWKQFIHIPDLSAEKAAKRAAQAEIKAEKKRLQKEGFLLAEIKPPKEKGSGLPVSIIWESDSIGNGLVLVWRSVNHFIKPADNEQNTTEFFTIQPPWNTPLQPVGLKTNSTAHIFCISPSANWLVAGFAGGDWKILDWRNKKLAFEERHTRAAGWMVFSQNEQLIYSLCGEEFVVTSMAEKRPVITIKGVGGARGATVHPSGRFVAVGLQSQLGIVDVEKGQLIKKLWINRRMETLDRWRNLSDKQVAEKYLKNPEQLKRLRLKPEQKIEAWVAENRFIKFETKEHLFDVRFSPNGEQLFIASNGMRVFDWNKILLANEDAPAPEFSVDAPKDDENNPNSRPLAYSVCFDPERNLLLSSCLAGTIQYLNVKNGQSGTLLKPPGEVSIWRLELTHDRQALCCHSGSRPSIKNQNKRESCVQVWNYPALCKAAGLD